MTNARRLSSIGSRHLRHRRGRSLLTAFGIVLGVAILFGVLVSNSTTNRGLEKLIEDFTGRADVLVTPTGARDLTMPTGVAGRLAALPGVEAVAGSYLFPGSLGTNDLEPERVIVQGIRLDEQRLIQNYALERGRFFRDGADEGMIARKLADKAGIRLGDDFDVGTPLGFRSIELVGILKDTGAGRSNQGDSIFTSLETARSMGGVGDVIRLASVVLTADTDIAQWVETHQAVLGPGFDFENAETLAQDFLAFVEGIQVGFTFFAAIALFVGAFLIYLTLTMAVAERTREFGTLRSLGATRRQVRRVVLVEAISMSVVSTILGLLLGLAIAKVLLVMVSKLFEVELEGLAVGAGSVVLSAGVGIVVTLIAALIPARRAARVSPVDALRGLEQKKLRLSKGWVIGVIAAPGGFFISRSASNVYLQSAGTLLLLLGTVLLVPLLLRPLAFLLGKLTRKMARGSGDVAVLHLVKERSRSAYTLALIMVVMAMIFANGGIQSSLRSSIDTILDRVYGADLIISSNGVRFKNPVEEELRRTDGVAQVAAVHYSSTFTKRTPKGEEAPAVVIISEPIRYFEVESLDWVEGNDPIAIDALARDNTVLIADSLGRSAGKGVGDEITLRTTSGNKKFEIAAIYRSILGPDIFMGLSAAAKHLGTENPTEFHLKLERGTTVSEVKRTVDRTIGASYNLEFQTAEDIKDEAGSQLRQFTGVFLAILFVAAIIGLLGLANTLAMSVAQRSREIGVLRAVGTTRGHIRRMVLVESVTLGLVAFVLSLPLGWFLSADAVTSMKDVMGFQVAYVYPAVWVPAVAAFGAVVAVVAALAPARRAARLQVVEVLRFE